jgi:hypothetical protein
MVDRDKLLQWLSYLDYIERVVGESIMPVIREPTVDTTA